MSEQNSKTKWVIWILSIALITCLLIIFVIAYAYPSFQKHIVNKQLESQKILINQMIEKAKVDQYGFIQGESGDILIFGIYNATST